MTMLSRARLERLERLESLESLESLERTCSCSGRSVGLESMTVPDRTVAQWRCALCSTLLSPVAAAGRLTSVPAYRHG